MKTSKLLCVILLVLATTAQAQATSWYFDKDSVGGACSDTGSGTITQPFCNIYSVLWNGWNGAQAGDTIYIRRGTYNGRLFWIKAGVLDNGSPSSPITIRPYPGETVIFDGQGTADLLIKFAGSTNYAHDLSFIGPFEAKNYATILDGDAPVAGRRTNLTFDGWTIHHTSMGLLFRMVDNVTVRNSTFYNLKGLPTTVGDNVIGVSVRGNATIHSDNILIENCTAYDINDGKGNDNGDADGFHTDQYCDRATFRNLSAYRCAEDGVDTKAQTVIMDNIIAHDNGATGIKMWGGGQGRVSTYTTSRLLSYGNTETGVKCTGNGDTVTATIDHLTAWGNGEENLKNTTGVDTSSACHLTVRNSILGQGGIDAILFPVPRTGLTTYLGLDHVNITHSGSATTISASGCSPLSGKYSTAQYTNGTFNTDMSAGVDCLGLYGTMSGSATSPTSFDPQLIDAPPVFEWAAIATAAITSNTLTLVTEANYPWPNPVVGHYLEIDDDGVKRQITGIGDATTRTINFSPAVSSTVCGRATDCRGVRIVGWATGTTSSENLHLATTSLAKNAGVWVNGVHCAQADDNGGSALTGCIHWRGAAPDLGYAEFIIPALQITTGTAQ